MNLTVPLYAVFLVAAGIGAAYAVYRVLRALRNSAGRNSDESAKLRETISLNTAALTCLAEMMTPACNELRSNLAGVPKLLESVTKIGEAQLEIMQAQRGAAQSPPLGRPNGPRAPRDVEADNLEYEVRQMQRSEGISREEALLKMNGANQRSVWDGDIFQGWNR